MDTISILRKGRVAKRKTMNKTLKQVVIEKSINNALKIALKATLLQERKQNRLSAEVSITPRFEQEKSNFDDFCRSLNTKKQKENRQLHMVCLRYKKKNYKQEIITIK